MCTMFMMQYPSAMPTSSKEGRTYIYIYIYICIYIYNDGNLSLRKSSGVDSTPELFAGNTLIYPAGSSWPRQIQIYVNIYIYIYIMLECNIEMQHLKMQQIKTADIVWYKHDI